MFLCLTPIWSVQSNSNLFVFATCLFIFVCKKNVILFYTLQLLTDTILHQIQFRKVPMAKIGVYNKVNLFKMVWDKIQRSKIACSFGQWKSHVFLVNQKIFPTKKEIQLNAKKVYCKKLFGHWSTNKYDPRTGLPGVCISFNTIIRG